VVERNIMKQPLTEPEIVALAKRLGGVREMVAPKRRAEAEEVPDARLAAWLAANPNFVRRPLIDTGKGLEAGFTAEVRERLGG
jgi:arsenate reductase